MKSWLVLVHGHEQNHCSTVSSETWEFKQEQNTASPFSLFSLPGHTLTSVLQLSLMGDQLSREQQTPSPRNTSLVGASSTFILTGTNSSNTSVLDRITLMWRWTQGTFGLYMHCSICEEALFSCRKTITAALFSSEPRAYIPKEHFLELLGKL